MPRDRRIAWWNDLLWIAAAACVALVALQNPLLAEEPVDFAADVLPILQQRCQQCHGGIRRESDLSLLTRRDALLPASSGSEAIVPGEPEGSELLRRVETTDEFERMPPSGDPLTAMETDLLRRWIRQGAAWPQHWAFLPVTRPPLPTVQQAGWVRNPIDSFILQRLEAQRMEPSAEARREVLIRRLYLDLIGLLPGVEETRAAADDARSDWYERLVDRLLASPHFGERWGRHWLDQARYADSDGFEVDGPRPFAWRWRDWVIDAFNSDMPFDEFSVQQIAGDLLPNATDMHRLATSFHRQSLTNREGGIDRDEARFKELVDRVNATGTLWLGITVGCAQCHDHPYDAFTQREYYQLYAFFNQTDDSELVLTTQRMLRPVKKDDDPHQIRPRVVSQSPHPRRTSIYQRGDFLQPGAQVQPAVPQHLYPSAPATGRTEELNRVDLARWIGNPENPLTSRVAVNQMWSRLFGAGLVRTPGDFGARGAAATHPQLLDYLADDYRAGGWSIKRLIRRIVTSAAYRQASMHRPTLETADPLNTLWHRQNRYRVEAELVRDLCLDASGLLCREIGGPSIYPPVAEEFIKLSFRSNYNWPTSSGADRYRRGLYVFYKRTLPYPNLDTFGCPDATTSSMQREISNTPLQALVAMNNAVHVEASQALMRRVVRAAACDRDRLKRAFRICLNEEPSDDQLRRLEQLLSVSRQFYQAHHEDAQTLVGDNQPRDIAGSEAAAWVVISNVLLNLDQFLTRE